MHACGAGRCASTLCAPELEATHATAAWHWPPRAGMRQNPAGSLRRGVLGQSPRRRRGQVKRRTLPWPRDCGGRRSRASSALRTALNATAGALRGPGLGDGGPARASARVREQPVSSLAGHTGPGASYSAQSWGQRTQSPTEADQHRASRRPVIARHRYRATEPRPRGQARGPWPWVSLGAEKATGLGPGMSRNTTGAHAVGPTALRRRMPLHAATRRREQLARFQTRRNAAPTPHTQNPPTELGVRYCSERYTVEHAASGDSW